MTLRQQLRFVLAVIAGILSLETAIGGDSVEPLVEFNRDIRPILSENCFFCHGPDKDHREAELRLDVADDAFADRGEYFAIVPGKPEESEIWARISSGDLDELMPPQESHKQLSAHEKELLHRWIKEGANWQGHWAFVPPERPPLPQSNDDLSNPIDRFVRQQLVSERLTPSPEADRRTLARRLSIDLTGLPSSSEEIEAFVKSNDTQAYGKLVDRLLASPHYGERMAQFWLDLVRYADTSGFHGDNPRSHSLYRDYVIRTFNENVRFDQFTIEQLSGDLLPEATNEQRIASGYNRLNMTTREGGSQPKEFMAKYAADRVRNAASVWLGITMGCCECHDHKFDPFTTREFYEFEAFFADLDEVPVGEQQPVFLPIGKDAARVAELQKQLTAVEAKLHEQTKELDAAQIEWEASLQIDNANWVLLRPLEASALQGSMEIRDDGSLFANSDLNNPVTNTYIIKAKTTLPKIAALRIDVFRDPSLPGGGPGRAPNGNFVLNEFELRIKNEQIPFRHASASFSQEGWHVAGAIDHDPQTGWAIQGQANQKNSAVFLTNSENLVDHETPLTITLIQNHGQSHTLGHFQLFVTDTPDPLDADQVTKLPYEVAQAVRFDLASRPETQRAIVAKYFRLTTPLLSKIREQASALQQQIDQINQQSAILASVAIEPRTMRVLPKGDWLNESGDVVMPGVPECLPELGTGDRRATRLDLANWLVRDDHPLVARVLVNRLWRLMFGRGLVTSLDDFGAQGTWPSHPELLDWLAKELIDSSWDIKHMLRLMAMSQTYRQSSFVSKQLLQSDPGNQWLARQGRFRFDAEMVRDNVLAVSGLLSAEIGGQSVKPYQPAGYWHHLNFPQRVYKHDTGKNLYRRGLYTHWQRTFLHPSLLAFDAPTREDCAAKRPRSNTPLQALVLLNDPTYVEAARVFAERMIHEGAGDTRQTIRYAFQQILARTATDSESTRLRQFYQEQRQRYEADKKAATALIEIGEWPVPQDIDPVELAAWTSVARVLFNLHETITRY